MTSDVCLCLLSRHNIHFVAAGIEYGVEFRGGFGIEYGTYGNTPDGMDDKINYNTDSKPRGKLNKS